MPQPNVLVATIEDTEIPPLATHCPEGATLSQIFLSLAEAAELITEGEHGTGAKSPWAKGEAFSITFCPTYMVLPDNGGGSKSKPISPPPVPNGDAGSKIGLGLTSVDPVVDALIEYARANNNEVNVYQVRPYLVDKGFLPNVPKADTKGGRVIQKALKSSARFVQNGKMRGRWSLIPESLNGT